MRTHSRRDLDTPRFKTLLHLAYRARRHPEDMEVLHDALLEYYPEYRETVEQAEALAQQNAVRQIVYFHPKRAIQYEKTRDKLRREPSWAKRPATLQAYLEDNMPPRFNIARISTIVWMRGAYPAWMNSIDVDRRINRDAFLNISGWQRAVATYLTKSHLKRLQKRRSVR